MRHPLESVRIIAIAANICSTVVFLENSFLFPNHYRIIVFLSISFHFHIFCNLTLRRLKHDMKQQTLGTCSCAGCHRYTRCSHGISTVGGALCQAFVLRCWTILSSQSQRHVCCEVLTVTALEDRSGETVCHRLVRWWYIV